MGTIRSFPGCRMPQCHLLSSIFKSFISAGTGDAGAQKRAADSEMIFSIHIPISACRIDTFVFYFLFKFWGLISR